MFMVINKDKIISYIVSFSTVAILFIMSFAMTKNNENIMQTSTNLTQNVYNSNNLENENVINKIITNSSKKGNNSSINEYNTTGEK